MAVGARDHEAVQHREIDRPLDIEAEPPRHQQGSEDILAADLTPQPAKHQVGADAEPPQLRKRAAVEGRQHDRAARMTGGGSDQGVKKPRCLDLIAPAQRLDHPLHMAAALASILDEIQIFVATDLLDANEHGAASWSPAEDTTRHSNMSRDVADNNGQKGHHLAPHFQTARQKPRFSAPFRRRQSPKCGSWVKKPRCLDLIAPAQRLDHPLHMAAALASILDEIQIFVATDLLDANEHGAASWSPAEDTTRHSNLSRDLADNNGQKGHHLAPHFQTARQKPRFSAPFRRRQSPKCGSWV